MKRLMIISDCYPSDLTDGKHLRVYNLCKELCNYYDCYFVGLSQGQDSSAVAEPLPFREVAAFDERVRLGIPWWRWFRLSDAHYVSESSPKYFATSVRQLKELAAQWQIDATLTFEARLAEVTMSLDLPRILDFPDCGSLAIARRLANPNRTFSLPEMLKLNLRKLRAGNREKYFLRNFTRTVTISAQDRVTMLQVSGVDDSRVRVVPNGVSLDAFRASHAGNKRARSVVFWGNLDFPPNWTAVNYFYEKVFVPFLAPQDIEWHIVGAGADARIREIGRHENIVLAGFQEDLAAYLAGMGAMINPMVEGGGLKNKVLEAFAMELPVVSTSMGAEAIDCAAGKHLLTADTPQQFAEQILKVLENRDLAARLAKDAKELVMQKYSWPGVGRIYAGIVDEVLGVK